MSEKIFKKIKYSEADRRRARRRRFYDRKNKLCIVCHKPLDREGAYCESCLAKQREYHRERKETLLSLGICPICKKNDIIIGKETACPECKAKKYIRDRQYRNVKNENERRKAEERRRAGICIRCGKNKVEEGRTQCRECLEKLRQWREKKQKPHVKAEWKSQGKCALCGKDELVPGKLVCPDCYRICMANIRICNQTRKEGYNQRWKDTNMRIRAKYKIGRVYKAIKENRPLT